MRATNDVAHRSREEPHRRPGDRSAREHRHALRRLQGAASAGGTRRRGRREPPASRACRASSSSGRSPRCPRSFVMAGATPADDVLLGEDEPFHFAPSGCVAKTLDFRTGIRRPSTLAGPAGVHRPHGRAAGAGPHVDAGERHRRAARAARARGVLHDAHRDVQARDVRRLPARGRRGPPHLRGAVAATSRASASGRASPRSSPRPRRCRSRARCSTSTSPWPLTACPSRSTP